MKIHAIGEPDAVLGFLLAGCEGRGVKSRAEASRALAAAAADPQVGVILITERAAALIEQQVDAMRVSSSGPVLIEIPGPGGPRSDRPSLEQVIRRATGVRV